MKYCVPFLANIISKKEYIGDVKFEKTFKY